MVHWAGSEYLFGNIVQCETWNKMLAVNNISWDWPSSPPTPPHFSRLCSWLQFAVIDQSYLKNVFLALAEL